MAIPIPIADLDLPPENSPPTCSECGEPIEDEACVEDGEYLHTACCEAVEEELRDEEESFANANCRITRKLHRFDESKEWACSPDDYEMGARESYTANSVRAKNRHERTNYDELLPSRLDNSMWARARRSAVRARIDELLDSAGDDQYEDR